MGRLVTLALVQIDSTLGDVQKNVEKVIECIKDAAKKGATIVIFPELVLTGYNPILLEKRLNEVALTVQDESIRKLTQTADEENVHIIVGFVEERTIPGVFYNSILICGPDGLILKTYAKTHLFSTEKLYFRPGSSFNVLQTSFGIVGPMICMDISYPEVSRILSLQGAELLIASSAWIKEDEDLWDLHLRARAQDNLVFVAGVNRIGDEGKLHFIGKSRVVDPRGHVLAELGNEEDILIYTIDLDEVTRARRRALHLTGRRPELYKAISDPY